MVLFGLATIEIQMDIFILCLKYCTIIYVNIKKNKLLIYIKM